MTLKRRVATVFFSLLTILVALILYYDPEDGIDIVVGLLSTSLIIYGLQTLLYYLTMARHMVNGRSILWRGAILLLIGLYTSSITAVPHFYVTLYLFITLLFAGAVDVMRALDARKLTGSMLWFKLISGVINITAGFLCLILSGHSSMSVYIYATGLILSALWKIAESFRKTAIKIIVT